MDSPPKRMTRARAAARASADTIKSARIKSVAAKAQFLPSATANTKNNSAKKKVRADEKDGVDDELPDINTRRVVRRRLRNDNGTIGRGAVPAENVSTVSRSRATSKTISEVSDEHYPLAAARTRGCVKNPSSQQPTSTTIQTDNKTIRTRADTGTVLKTALDDPMSLTRGIVKLQRQGKENVSFATRATAKSSHVITQGYRGRPTCRAMATVPTQSSTEGPNKPLSHKKATQMPISRDMESSEDEPRRCDGLRMTAKRPRRLAKDKVSKDEEAENASTEHEDDRSGDASQLKADPGAGALGSSPRRLPLSTPKVTLKSPAKRFGVVPLHELNLQSGTIPADERDILTSLHHFKVLLQSSPKRPPSPTKELNFPTRPFGTAAHRQQSMTSRSMLQSLPKRAMVGVWSPRQHRIDASTSLIGPPQMQSVIAAALPNHLSGRPSDFFLSEESDDWTQNSIAKSTLDALLENPRSSKLMSSAPRSQTDSRCIGQPADKTTEDTEPLWTNDATPSETEYLGGPEVLLQEDNLQTSCTALECYNEELAKLHDIVPEMKEIGEVLAININAQPATAESHDELNLRTRDDVVGPCCGSKSEVEFEDDVFTRETVSVLHGKKELDRRSCQKRSQNSVVPFGSDASPTEGTFFQDEPMVHTDFSAPRARNRPQPQGDDNHDVILLTDTAMLDDDIAVAQKANAMSPTLQKKSEEAAINRSREETPSDASQEYGDENQVPTEPTLPCKTTRRLATPARPLRQTAFFTTTKVPLKAEDDSVPNLPKRVSSSASRASSQITGNLLSSATSILRSPTTYKRRATILPRGDMFSAPIKGDERWSADTPVNSLRRTVDPALLRGCIVLVDVHTTEGADASGIFVELLTHMGAKCVKTWHWNPSDSYNGDSSASKVGITHVVFKDGGKRTMEKVREAGGVVHCVGVSWVLDCERDNVWLDEAPYYLDTSVIPRGGARRRKSMEPKAIANSNGTIVPSINKIPVSLSTPKNRRKSALWVCTPSEHGDGEEEDLDWSCALLTPVPKTPAPEAVAEYASELPVTPSEEDSDLRLPTSRKRLTSTCPWKKEKYHEMGHEVLSQDKGEQIVMSLMAARRKSLQFAPKTGSPLARMWN